MKALDRYLQSVRIDKAKKFVRKDDTVFDIGTSDGIMFKRWKGYIKRGVGIDPILKQEVKTDSYLLLSGYFPEVCPQNMTFDAITMLAVLEHIPLEKQKDLASHCHRLLNKKGRVIITVPSPRVDDILEILIKLKILKGMCFEEHYGFNPEDTTRIFSQGFRLLHHSRFQLGLNNLFVFEKE